MSRSSDALTSARELDLPEAPQVIEEQTDPAPRKAVLEALDVLAAWAAAHGVLDAVVLS